MQSHIDARMHAQEIYNLMRVPDKTTAECALRKAWNMCKTASKDVVALAMPLKPIPYSLASFNSIVANNSKQQDFVGVSFYIVYVGRCDGQEFGWSKAPYDNKNKKKEDQKPLYTLETSGEMKDHTRFWPFKKVSNNMNKGPRVEDIDDDKKLSYVLKGGTCFTVFLREDNFGEQKGLFEGFSDANFEEQGILPAYSPILVQLSGTNDEQAMKGNGLKLRRILPAPIEILHNFTDLFFASKQDLQDVQSEMAELVPLRTVTKPMQGCPMLCKLNENAFVFQDPDTGVVEIVDSGIDSSLGKKLVLNEKILLTAMHSNNVNRSLRMLSIAIAHNAVKCIFVQSKGESGASDLCTVIYMHVDMSEAFWLNMMHKTKNVDCPTTLPKTSLLTMCFGKPIADSCKKTQNLTFQLDGGMPCLQWYNPSQLVQVATPDGREMLCNVVFEMHLDMKQSAGQRDVNNKLLFMDEVSGFHYVIKVFHAQSVTYTEENGLNCTNPILLVTWQFRPGLVASALSVSGIQRKRLFMSADNLDFMNIGDVIEENLSEESDYPTPALSSDATMGGENVEEEEQINFRTTKKSKNKSS